jgi:hypothetical protein
MRPRVPRLPDAFDTPPVLGEAGPRRERRGRDDAKRHTKPGARKAGFEGAAKKGPRRERVGGRVYGLDVDDVVESNDAFDEVEE